MATNFPASLDTAAELGPNFINDVAITDTARQIDATFRTNTKDAMFAVEARIGITNSTVNTSLTWATLCVGGTPNQGLRCVGSSATWPGAVGEDGLFIDSATSFPAWHRAGEAVGTFYQLASAASVMSLQNSYNGGDTIITAGANPVAIEAAVSQQAFIVDSDPAALDFAAAICDDSSNDSMILYLGDGTVANIGATTVPRVVVWHDGRTNINADCSSALDPALYVAQNNAAGSELIELVDGNAAVVRLTVDQLGRTNINSNLAAAGDPCLQVTQNHALGSELLELVDRNAGEVRLVTNQLGETTLRSDDTNILVLHDSTAATDRFTFARATGFFTVNDGRVIIHDTGAATDRITMWDSGVLDMVADNLTAVPMISMDQQATGQGFFGFEGVVSSVIGSGNLNDNIAGGGGVIGPEATDYTWKGMVRVYITGSGGLPTGDYWLPVYSA